MNIAEKKLEENLLLAKTGLRLSNKTSRYFSEIEIPKKSLVLLCGTPRSGKTTVAKKICKQLANSTYIDIDYWFDSAVKDLYPNEEYLTEEEIDCIAKKAYGNAYRTAKESLEKEKVVVWDDLEIYPTDRAEVLQGLKGKYAYAILIVVNCNQLKAICRSIKNGDTQTRTNLILDTYIYLQLQLQNPTKYFIGFDEVYIIDETAEITVKEP